MSSVIESKRMRKPLLEHAKDLPMKDFNRTLVLVCLSLLIGASALAQDWPQWRGNNRDAKATDFKAPKTWPKELRL